MPRVILVAIAALAAATSFGTSPSRASGNAPWCALISLGQGSTYLDCQYFSFEDCYRRANILAGNRGFCNVSPYYAAGSPEQRQTRSRRAHPY
jgi:hypothetical protein